MFLLAGALLLPPAARADDEVVANVRDGHVVASVRRVIPAGGPASVELPPRCIVTGFRTEAPARMTWEGVGRARIALPAGTAFPAAFAATWELECLPWANGEWVFSPRQILADRVTVDGEVVPVIRGVPVPAAVPTAAAAALGEVVVGEARWWRLTVAVPAGPGDLPDEGAHVVFLVDRSRSQGEDGTALQLDVVRAYARLHPAAQLAVVAWDRAATPLWPGFLPAGEAAARLPAAIPLTDGTNPRAGLLVARALLDGVPGPHRTVLLTDGLHPPTVAPADLVAARPDGLVHVLRLSGRERAGAVWRRDVDDPLAAVAHDGVYAEAALPRGIPGAAERIAEGLSRPTAVEAVTIAVDGAPVHPTPTALPAGQRLEWFVQAPADTPAHELTVEGRLWGEARWTVTAARTPAADREAARWLATSSAVYDDDGAALHGVLSGVDVLSPARALESDGRTTRWVEVPLPEGGGSIVGGIVGRGGGGGGGMATAAAAVPLSAAFDASGCGKVRGATVDVWTSFDEVADVRVEGAGKASACLEERGWAVRPPASEPPPLGYVRIELE